jgi:hypothetical protein
VLLSAFALGMTSAGAVHGSATPRAAAAVTTDVVATANSLAMEQPLNGGPAALSETDLRATVGAGWLDAIANFLKEAALMALEAAVIAVVVAAFIELCSLEQVSCG